MGFKTIIETNKLVDDLPIDKLPNLTPGVITEAPSSYEPKAGDVVVVVNGQVAYLTNNGWFGNPVSVAAKDGIRVRRLKADESVTIQGK